MYLIFYMYMYMRREGGGACAFASGALGEWSVYSREELLAAMRNHRHYYRYRV